MNSKRAQIIEYELTNANRATVTVTVCRTNNAESNVRSSPSISEIILAPPLPPFLLKLL